MRNSIAYGGKRKKTMSESQACFGVCVKDTHNMGTIEDRKWEWMGIV